MLRQPYSDMTPAHQIRASRSPGSLRATVVRWLVYPVSTDQYLGHFTDSETALVALSRPSGKQGTPPVRQRATSKSFKTFFTRLRRGSLILPHSDMHTISGKL